MPQNPLLKLYVSKPLDEDTVAVADEDEEELDEEDEDLDEEEDQEGDDEDDEEEETASGEISMWFGRNSPLAQESLSL